jgi:hypothetical protein
MIEFFTGMGRIISAAIVLVALTIYLIMRITWRCGICGKVNTTGILKFLFLMCDHEGDTN